jgi:hypothetical protein
MKVAVWVCEDFKLKKHGDANRLNKRIIKYYEMAKISGSLYRGSLFLKKINYIFVLNIVRLKVILLIIFKKI